MAITKNLVNIGNANISNTLTADALKKRNGTNKQILLADGTTKDMGTGTTTFLRNDGTWATPPTGTDTKQSISASTEKIYLTGVKSTSTTSEGYANANVYMLNGGLVASSLSVTTATISTLNGSTVPNSPKFSDTVYTHPAKTQSDSTSTAKPGHGGSFTVVDGVTRDSLGHVSGINVKTVTLPGSGNTDEKVKVSTSTTNANFPLMAVATSNVTNGGTYQAIYDSGIVINPNKHSVAEGYSSIASGYYSHAEGDSATASGTSSHAEGYKPTASGTSSHAEGYWTTASATASHAEGAYTRAIGGYSHAEGYLTTASGWYSHAGGLYTIADVQQVTAIGRYNSICSNGDLFVVGNGTDDNTRKTVFKVSDSTGTTSGGRNAIVTVTGRVNANEGFFQTSDINKKNIIGGLDLDKAYDLIDKCQTILYTLKDDDSDKELIGLIAQEVKEFFPELITEDNDGALSLDYSRLTVVILKVLKDIINRIKILESK